MSPSDAKLAVCAAEAGAAVVRSMYGRSLARIDKSASDFATEADLASEAAILGLLRAHRPEDALIGEETGASGQLSADRTWLVDPLCGTLNFAAETPLAAVNVALRNGAHVEVAASADPVAAEVFWTDGEAAWLRRCGTDERLVPSARSRLVDLNIDAPPPDFVDPQAIRLLSDPGFVAAFRPRVLSSTLAVAWVAAGRRAAYVTAGDLRDSVHFASGIALCQAAGCVVTGLFGQPLHTGQGGLIAAADAETHAAVLEAVRRQTLDADTPDA